MKLIFTIIFMLVSYVIHSQSNLNNILKKFEREFESCLSLVIDSSYTSSEIELGIKSFEERWMVNTDEESNVKVFNHYSDSPYNFPSFQHYCSFLYFNATSKDASCDLVIESFFLRDGINSEYISIKPMLFLEAEVVFNNAKINSHSKVFIEATVEINSSNNNIEKILIEQISKYDPIDNDKDGIIDIYDLCITEPVNYQDLNLINSFGCLDEDKDGYSDQISNSDKDNKYTNLYDQNDSNPCVPDSTCFKCIESKRLKDQKVQTRTSTKEEVNSSSNNPSNSNSKSSLFSKLEFQASGGLGLSFLDFAKNELYNQSDNTWNSDAGFATTGLIGEIAVHYNWKPYLGIGIKGGYQRYGFKSEALQGNIELFLIENELNYSDDVFIESAKYKFVHTSVGLDIGSFEVGSNSIFKLSPSIGFIFHNHETNVVPISILHNTNFSSTTEFHEIDFRRRNQFSSFFYSIAASYGLRLLKTFPMYVGLQLRYRDGKLKYPEQNIQFRGGQPTLVIDSQRFRSIDCSLKLFYFIETEK